MDIQQFASKPSDPHWEKPGWSERHVIVIKFHAHQNDHGDGQSKVSDVDPTESHGLDAHTAQRQALVEALEDAASKLNKLCATDAPVVDVQAFLAQWEDPSSNAGRIQPNVLAWFNDTNSVRLSCQNDNRDVLRVLLKKGLQPTSKAVAFAKAKWMETRNIEVLQLLIDHGWNINQPINHNTPPLMSMLLTDYDMVGWCLSLGADPNASSPAGETIMQRAASYGSLDVLRLLVEHGSQVRGLDVVARACFYSKKYEDEPERPEVVRFLLDHGGPIDAYWGGDTVEAERSCLDVFIGKQNGLHLAIESGNRDLVKLLVDRGANKKLPTSSAMRTRGQTVSPVELAKICGHEDMIFLLESQDTTINIP